MHAHARDFTYITSARGTSHAYIYTYYIVLFLQASTRACMLACVYIYICIQACMRAYHTCMHMHVHGHFTYVYLYIMFVLYNILIIARCMHIYVYYIASVDAFFTALNTNTRLRALQRSPKSCRIHYIIAQVRKNHNMPCMYCFMDVQNARIYILHVSWCVSTSVDQRATLFLYLFSLSILHYIHKHADGRSNMHLCLYDGLCVSV